MQLLSLSDSVDCAKCKSRRIPCDRTLPKCRKCFSRSFECPGYGIILRWNEGVTSKGRVTERRSPKRPQESVSPLISEISHSLSTPSLQLLRHFDQNIATKLAWVDGPENPWRHIILPLSHASPIVLYSVLAMSSEDLAHKYAADHPSFQKFQAESLRHRDRVLSLLPQHLGLLLNTPSSTECVNQGRFALASVLLLYNLELLTAEATQWRLHIQGARAIIQWKLQAIHRYRPPDIADIFLLYEYYFTAVFIGLTTFDTVDDIVSDIPANGSITIFTDFFRIIQTITRAERLRYTSANTATIWIEDIARELEAARGLTLQTKEVMQFQYREAREDFVHLTHMYYYASLIYAHRVLSEYVHSEDLIRNSREAMFDHLSHLMKRTYFAHDLVWPLFIAGTECRQFPDKQCIIEEAFLGVIRVSGSLDRRRVLSFLKMYWTMDVNSDTSWVHVARTRPGDCSFMII
ncbi:fungal-specific transcription factor domain-containing protein [Aspergillus avenaceus]|uniref:Fungal-specific transcription factor domain-containing protein n=1 Tax=Aspergillus avenaceus TaxID=36643 RepID=A0A5N6TYE5_ASPAV|nr:fungal-specific transcription factor domain-containing protein [Aspergillus avenaceus]